MPSVAGLVIGEHGFNILVRDSSFELFGKVDMITITRAYEAGQKVIRSYDSMLDKSVNQVGALK